jgi:magnesium chelatase family protein
VSVETHLSNGFRKFTIVGLPETAVKESKDRVRSALVQSGFEVPKGKIIVNLAPADLPKEGGCFDLPIAISILIASKQITCAHIFDYELAGELALSGALRAIKGVLPFALGTQIAGRQLIVPACNGEEASLVAPLTLYALCSLSQVTAHLTGHTPATPSTYVPTEQVTTFPCLSEICGQHAAKRALEIAAAGGHNLLFVGPPGAGKTMLASRLCGILPPLSQKEALEVAAIYSISHQGFESRTLWQRPFRGPHHTASAISLIGGGRQPLPGEVSLAHHGVLFLDEFPEFHRHVIEVLREPLESGTVNISRAAGRASFPASFQLIAAMNPCPCGYAGSPMQACICASAQIQRYRSKISGPLLDRIDMHVPVSALPIQHLATHHPEKEEPSITVQQRILAARERQVHRGPRINAKLLPSEITNFCKINTACEHLFIFDLQKTALSARAYHRILRMARTIADLEASENIEESHMQEAIGYRKWDRHLA